jgi:hypothetical protein
VDAVDHGRADVLVGLGHHHHVHDLGDARDVDAHVGDLVDEGRADLQHPEQQRHRHDGGSQDLAQALAETL